MSQSFNVGSDTKITILRNGARVGAVNLTHFEAKQDTTNVKSTAIDGLTRARELAQGWNLDFEWDRGNSEIDDMFINEEDLRFTGQPPSDFTVIEKTTNPDRSISRYRYEGVTLKLETAGERKGDAKVTQKVSGYASRRRAA